jgi:hypothetical protein
MQLSSHESTVRTSDAVKSILIAVDELRHSNEHAALVQLARAADRHVRAVEARRLALEKQGLASWHEGWELRSQAHAALMRSLVGLRERSRQAWAAANHYYAQHLAVPLGAMDDSASIELDRAQAQALGEMYRSGD